MHLAFIKDWVFILKLNAQLNQNYNHIGRFFLISFVSLKKSDEEIHYHSISNFSGRRL